MTTTTWRRDYVRSPILDEPVPVVVARDLPYGSDANRFQTLSIYLPADAHTSALAGKQVESLPKWRIGKPGWLVHVHGGAWRDPELTSVSIEPTVAHAFSHADDIALPVIASLNYRLSPFPTRPTLAYDPQLDSRDPARDAVHPQHLEDVLAGLDLLRSLGLDDDSYVLSGHSAGACLVLQAVLQPPAYYQLPLQSAPPRPAGVVTANGLYDLPALVEDLDATHEHLRAEYQMLLTNAFGPDRDALAAASPALLDSYRLQLHVDAGKSPSTFLVDQSPEDQLVPLGQRDRLRACLEQSPTLRIIDGHRCRGDHAAAWQRGDMIWSNILELLEAIKS